MGHTSEIGVDPWVWHTGSKLDRLARAWVEGDSGAWNSRWLDEGRLIPWLPALSITWLEEGWAQTGYEVYSIHCPELERLSWVAAKSRWILFRKWGKVQSCCEALAWAQKGMETIGPFCTGIHACKACSQTIRHPETILPQFQSPSHTALCLRWPCGVLDLVGRAIGSWFGKRSSSATHSSDRKACSWAFDTSQQRCTIHDWGGHWASYLFDDPSWHTSSIRATLCSERLWFSLPPRQLLGEIIQWASTCVGTIDVCREGSIAFEHYFAARASATVTGENEVCWLGSPCLLTCDCGISRALVYYINVVLLGARDHRPSHRESGGERCQLVSQDPGNRLDCTDTYALVHFVCATGSLCGRLLCDCSSSTIGGSAIHSATNVDGQLQRTGLEMGKCFDCDITHAAQWSMCGCQGSNGDRKGSDPFASTSQALQHHPCIVSIKSSTRFPANGPSGQDRRKPWARHVNLSCRWALCESPPTRWTCFRCHWIVVDEADLVRTASIFVAASIKQRRPAVKILLVSATYGPDTLSHFRVPNRTFHSVDVERPFPISVIDDKFSTDLVMALWTHLSHAMSGQFVLQSAAKRDVHRLSERLETMQIQHQALWSGISIDSSSPGYVMTELSRGVTFSLAISGPRELFASSGMLFIGAPSRTTVEQRNGRVGRTSAGVAVNLHPGVEREIVPHPSGSEFLQNPDFWQQRLGIVGMLMPYEPTPGWVRVNAFWHIHHGLLDMLEVSEQEASLVADLFHRCMSDEGLCRLLTQQTLDPELHFEDLRHRNYAGTTQVVDKLNSLEFNWTTARPFQVFRAGNAISFRTLHVRMHRLVFDQPSSPVIQAGQLEPDVYAARCLVDPLFGLPPNTRVVSPGAAQRKLSPDQSRYSALDLACYLNRGWPSHGKYDYSSDLPQALQPVELGDASYAESVCQWLSYTLQCPVDAHFLVTGSMKATHRSIRAELGSLRKLTVIADTSTLALVPLLVQTP